MVKRIIPDLETPMTLEGRPVILKLVDVKVREVAGLTFVETEQIVTLDTSMIVDATLDKPKTRRSKRKNKSD